MYESISILQTMQENIPLQVSDIDMIMVIEGMYDFLIGIGGVFAVLTFAIYSLLYVISPMNVKHRDTDIERAFTIRIYANHGVKGIFIGLILVYSSLSFISILSSVMIDGNELSDIIPIFSSTNIFIIPILTIVIICIVIYAGYRTINSERAEDEAIERTDMNYKRLLIMLNVDNMDEISTHGNDIEVCMNCGGIFTKSEIRQFRSGVEIRCIYCGYVNHISDKIMYDMSTTLNYQDEQHIDN